MESFIDYDQKDRKRVKSESSNVDPEFPHKTRNVTVTALFATAAMVAYAFSAGIIQVMMKNLTLYESLKKQLKFSVEITR